MKLDFQMVMDINLKGIFLFAKAVLPHMVRIIATLTAEWREIVFYGFCLQTTQNYGRIVNIASIAGASVFRMDTLEARTFHICVVCIQAKKAMLECWLTLHRKRVLLR